VTLWRISDHAELDGAGGLLAPGRWHTRGSRVVYCAPNPATSLVEVLVHIEIDSDDLPDRLRYLEIEAPDDISRETVNVDVLGRNWQANLEATRTAGGEWLRSGRTALFRVPSVIVPATWNVLINPEHRQSTRIRTIRIHRHAIDPRLVR
jgi:RES domain-containing protein